jgi:catechol 2,3-dioxygenase-like lactoylglutathione lyase family enzyme
MLNKLDHIGIAVKDLDQAIKLYKEVFGVEPSLVYESAYTNRRD